MEKITENRKYAAFTHSFNDTWEGKDIEATFNFAKPGKGEIKRLQDTAVKNPAQASRNLLLATIKPEEKDQLVSMLEEYPGLATSFSSALLKAVGITNDLGN